MYTIGRLARRARINADSIRFYERQGLLSPETKTGSGYRLYTDDAVRRITFIKHAQRCGFSLAEIAALLQMDRGATAARRRACELAVRKQSEMHACIESMQVMSAALASAVASAEVDDDPLYDRRTSVVGELEARLAERKAPAPAQPGGSARAGSPVELTS